MLLLLWVTLLLLWVTLCGSGCQIFSIAVGVCDSGKVREKVVGNAVDVGDWGVARDIGEDDVVVAGASVVSVVEEVVVEIGRWRVCCWG